MNEPTRLFPIPSPSSTEYAWLDALPIGGVVMTLEGEVVHANAEFVALLGLGVAPLAGRDLAGLAPGFVSHRPPDDPAGASRILQARRADGTEVCLSVTVRAFDALWLATFTPVAPATPGRETFREVFDTAPYGMALVASDGKIARANARLCAMFAYAADELEGEAIEVLVPHRAREGHGALRQAYFEQPTPRPLGEGRDLMGRKKDGDKFPVEIGLWPTSTDSGPMICASVIDITARKRSELRLREASRQLDEFTYIVAHDLRAPVRVVNQLIEFVIEDYGGTAPEGVIHNFDRMRKRIGGMERLIDDLLTYAREGRGEARIEPIDLAAIVQDVLNTNPPPPGLRLEVRIESKPFEGLRTPLLTTLRNLFSNAVMHHDHADMAISIRSRDEGDFVAIDVSDDGPGIPEAEQQRAFKLFQTLNRSLKREGGGLGLAVAKRLVTQHNGRIDLVSVDGRRGCTFRVWWPRVSRIAADE